MVPYHLNLAAVVVGTARAALDEYIGIAQTKTSAAPPYVLKKDDRDVQAAVGRATVMTDAAEGMMLRAAEECLERFRQCVTEGVVFSPADNMRLWGVTQLAGQTACEVVDLLFTLAGSSVASRGQKLARYLSDCAMYRTHPSSSAVVVAAGVGRSILDVGQRGVGITNKV
jgi:3-hydroxy-9,10-secoandrosta-1,3,5(10)-triene-9,17-dione monooxygenase